MVVAVIVQARMGSSRLPGKVLERVGGQAVLTHVLARAKRIRGVDAVAVTTTPEPADDAVVNLCRGAGVRWSRGQLPLAGRPGRRDVLAGYYVAADALRADVIVRITSDCPLLDPAVAEAVLGVLARRGRRALYASNVHPPTWYDGTDVEAFTMNALARAYHDAGPDEREHVTTHLWRHWAEPDVVNVEAPGGVDCSALKLSVDDRADLERVRRVWASLPDREAFGWRDVVDAYGRAYPSVASLRARALYGNAPASAGLRAAFVAGASSADDVVPAEFGEPRRAAWRLGRADAREGGYQTT